MILLIGTFQILLRIFWLNHSWGNSLVKLIIAEVSQCLPYNIQQFPDVLQRYFLKAKFLMLQLWICSHNAKMSLYIQAYMPITARYWLKCSKAIIGLDGIGLEISERTSSMSTYELIMHQAWLEDILQYFQERLILALWQSRNLQSAYNFQGD